MKKYCFVFVLLALFSCNKKTDSQSKNGENEIVNDTIPETRTSVKTSAAASYSEPVKDKDGLNNWKFAVDAFETPQTFKYLLKIQYKELRVEDTLTVPNFGIQPIVELKKGRDELSCQVGFKGKEGEFKEYKLVVVEDEQLTIKAVKGYRRALVRKK